MLLAMRRLAITYEEEVVDQNYLNQELLTIENMLIAMLIFLDRLSLNNKAYYSL
jgi:hypothetical protein